VNVATNPIAQTRSVPMSRQRIRLGSIVVASLAVAVFAAVGGRAIHAQDAGEAKYTVRVPNGLAFSEFRGYESWQTVAVSQSEKLMAVILANPVMINAYKSGIPGNGQPWPDGARMAKIHWNPKKHEAFANTMVPASLHDVDFMVKDSKRFADSAGWGWAAFKYDTASDRFMPATQADEPPQGNDAKCGLGCHTIVKARDYVFTDYGKR
jgi:cytochrome P460